MCLGDGAGCLITTCGKTHDQKAPSRAQCHGMSHMSKNRPPLIFHTCNCTSARMHSGARAVAGGLAVCVGRHSGATDLSPCVGTAVGTIGVCECADAIAKAFFITATPQFTASDRARDAV